MEILIAFGLGLYYQITAWKRFRDNTFNKYTVWIISISGGLIGLAVGAAAERIWWMLK